MQRDKIYDVCVIGSGPAGLFSAIWAGKKKSVVLIEKNEKLGRKILATGNGRCNITNKNINVNRYHGGDKLFIENVLKSFDQNESMKYFESLGILLKEEDRGRIFPRTNQAQTVLDALFHELEKENITTLKSAEVKDVLKSEVFKIITSGGKEILSKKLILATGGKAAHQFGSSGDGLFWAKKFGHTITPIHAALCPIETKDDWVKEVQGLKVDVEVRAVSNNNIIAESKGDLLFTHFGISGPAAMSLSGNISPILSKSDVEIFIDLFSENIDKELDKKLEQIFKNSEKKSVKNSLGGVIPQSLIPVILKLSEVDENKKAAEVSAKSRKEIVSKIKNLKLSVKNIRPLKEAQVTRGGVNLSEIDSKTLESKIVSGIFFAGEIMDVDGDSGGFNLQWAWSSGYLAGNSI